MFSLELQLLVETTKSNFVINLYRLIGCKSGASDGRMQKSLCTAVTRVVIKLHSSELFAVIK